MSRVEDLITALCPSGVSFKAVGEVVSKSSSIKWSNAGDETFSYIDLSSVDRVTRRIGETAAINSSTAPSRAQQIVRTGDVIFATTRPAQMRWAVIPADYDGQIASTGYCVLRPDTSVVLTNFLAHILGADTFRQYIEANQVAGNYPSIPDSRVRAYRIPVPPLEVQREIVRILDQFTQLEAEMEAEMEARNHQYAYYRDSLLTFHESSEVKRIPLGDVGEFIRGNGIQKSDFAESGVGAIHYGQVHTHYGTSADKTLTYVSPALAARLRHARTGDLVIATTSEDDAGVGKAVAWLGKDDVAVSGDAYIYRHSLNPKYVSYFFQSEQFRAQKLRKITGTKVRRLSGKALASITIPVPSTDEQERIVTILEKFDLLVNDLSIGLPAELAARRKQYEYYRDRLMTFEESVA